jgi:uncharacterized protein (DUF58 family)
MTVRGRFVVGLGLAAYLASWVFGSRPLVPVAAGLVVAPLAAWAWVRATTRPVRLDRVPRRDHALEGDDVEIELRAELGAAPPAVAIEERIGGLGARRTPLARRGRRATGRYALKALPRGRYPVEGAAAVVEDPFGFARSETPLEPGPALLVYPRLVQVDALFSELGRLNRGGRPLLLRRPTGYDLHSVREYVEGDSLRAVHWPSTAHRGQLMVKELEETPRDEVAVLLDCAGGGDAFEVAVRCAGSIVAAHDRRNRPAALVVNVGTNRIERDFTQALELLAGVRATPDAPIEELLAHEAARALEITVVTTRLPRALVDGLVGRRGAALVYVDASGSREPDLLRLASSGVPVTTVRPGDDLASRLAGEVARAS